TNRGLLRAMKIGRARAPSTPAHEAARPRRSAAELVEDAARLLDEVARLLDEVAGFLEDLLLDEFGRLLADLVAERLLIEAPGDVGERPVHAQRDRNAELRELRALALQRRHRLHQQVHV